MQAENADSAGLNRFPIWPATFARSAAHAQYVAVNVRRGDSTACCDSTYTYVYLPRHVPGRPSPYVRVLIARGSANRSSGRGKA